MAAMWLDRALVVGPYFVLCLTQKQFDAALQDIGTIKRPDMLDGSVACTHRFRTRDGRLACVVALDPKGLDGIAIASLLVHEAVHVFQYYCEHIGDTRPSVEFEAYSIQHLAESMMRSYLILKEQ